MNKPDISKYNPSPEYLRSLIDAAGLSQRGAAATIGLNERTMRAYLSIAGIYRPGNVAPYCVQYALEACATNKCPECLDYHVGLAKGDTCDECVKMLAEVKL